MDQLQHYATSSDTSFLQQIQDHEDMRQFLCNHLLDDIQLQESCMDDQTEGKIEEYYKRMTKLGTYGDHVMLKVAATIFNRNIKIHYIFKMPFLDLTITPMNPNQAINAEWNLLFYDDIHFLSPHYRSIFPKNDPEPAQPSQTPKNSTLQPMTRSAHFQNISISPVQPPLHLPSQQDQG